MGRLLALSAKIEPRLLVTNTLAFWASLSVLTKKYESDTSYQFSELFFFATEDEVK
jgi:hypothetical protein